MKISKVAFHLSSDQACQVEVNGKTVGHAYRWLPSQEINATAAVHPGRNVAGLTITQEDGYPPAVLGEIVVEAQGTAPQNIPIGDNWQVLPSALKGWQQIGFQSPLAEKPAILDQTPWGTPTSSLHQRPVTIPLTA